MAKLLPPPTTPPPPPPLPPVPGLGGGGCGLAELGGLGAAWGADGAMMFAALANFPALRSLSMDRPRSSALSPFFSSPLSSSCFPRSSHTRTLTFWGAVRSLTVESRFCKILKTAPGLLLTRKRGRIFSNTMAPTKYGDIGKTGNNLLNDDYKYEGKCEVKTKLESGVVGNPPPPPSLTWPETAQDFPTWGEQLVESLRLAVPTSHTGAART
jgi:hypothetical protein